jgi:hypothetical protein
MRVNFLIAGTQKGGTSALDCYLREHPDVCMAQVKETHFFDNEAFFARRAPDYAHLHAHFRPKAGQLLGEATPITMYWADAPRRVWEYNPRMKLICLLRNPVERAFSHWNMERDRGADNAPFAEALRREAERCRAALPLQHRVYSYADRGFYCEQIRRLWRFFPRAQTLFLKSEELTARPQETLYRVFAFLGVPRRPVEPRVVHARPYAVPLGGAEREHLVRLYEWEVRQLERLLDWDCRNWLAASPGETDPLPE